MPPGQDQPSLLDSVYAELDLVGSNLLDAVASPSGDSHQQNWRERGDWLQLAARVNAERVFFVNDDPVLVFSSLPPESDDKAIFDCYRRTWSLARPRCLFLAIGTELRVYSLSSPPIVPGPGQEPLTALEIVTRSADVREKLSDFHRTRLESGAAFEDPALADKSGRADQQLLRDVRAATQALADAGLPARIAHTLIERAILVRYLEDRAILTGDYFEQPEAFAVPSAPTKPFGQQPPDFGQPSKFIPTLSSKERTYELFERLARDFNGDLFVTDHAERETVQEHHLKRLMELLQGTLGAGQPPLFLWAYDFSVIPTSLISNMYELFYHDERSEDHANTYYTPPELVEFVLADVLDHRMLDRDPTVCDPACGSGIFLVEAFRRIVRHEILREGKPLSSKRLRDLLLSRIAGCDVDEAAIRLAAFSLYVAFLNYQSPQDIRRAGPLPRLIHQDEGGLGTAPLVVGDAFWRRKGEDAVETVDVSGVDGELPWDTGGFDVVVGNPPWTEPSVRPVRAEQWASGLGRTIGDRSPSQLFLWRAFDLLSPDGVAALLVSAKVAFNVRSTSRQFREEWLGAVRLDHVVNFSSVRKDFFKSSRAPFMLLRFRRGKGKSDGAVVYEMARPVPSGRSGSSALARLDREVVSQASLRARDYLWKTYSAGSLRDDAFLARLELEDRLRKWTSDHPHAYGFQRASDQSSGHVPSRTLRSLRSLAKFESWGPLRDDWLEPVPVFVKSVPNERIFHGRRLIVRRGVSPRFGPHARLETGPFAFRHTIYGISLDHLPAWQAKVILGILLSSLGRYWLYMVSGSWGSWRDEVRSTELLNLPVRMSSLVDPVTRRIERAVDELQGVVPTGASSGGRRQRLPSQMEQIDDGVAELFTLTDVERDLVDDFWAGQAPDATYPIPDGMDAGGTESDLHAQDQRGIVPYLQVFLRAWNSRLGDNGEFSWRLWRDRRTEVVAVVFETLESGTEDASRTSGERSEEWRGALDRVGVNWEASETQSILRYGMVRAVADTAIVVVKRDERHLWTPTAARQDVDATIAQVMSLRWQ